MKTNPSQQHGAARVFRVLALVAVALGCWGIETRAEEESSIEDAFRDALYAEEVKGDVEAALKVYQDVGKRFDHQRNLAATALFREGECLRKLKRDVEAAEAYERVLALYGDVERVALQARESLLALGKTAPEPTEGGSAIAVDQEATEILRLKKLVEESPDLLNASTDDQPPPLHEAVSRGQRRVAAFLLDSGAKGDLVWEGETPLQTAARTGHKAMCELLLERDANGEEDKAKALVVALKHGREAVARLLLDKEADPNLATIEWQDDRGYKFADTSALILAIQGGIPHDLASRLLEAGADPARTISSTIRGDNKDMKAVYLSPLGEAIRGRNIELVKAILEAGVDPNRAEGGETSPLSMALLSIESDSPPEATDDPIVTALLKAGADWKEARDDYGSSALQTAAVNGLTGYMREALDAGCEARTALRSAFVSLQPGAVRLLLDAGADPNASNSQGQSILHHYWLGQELSGEQLQKGLECLRLLLEGGADPDALFNNDTALSEVIGAWYGSQAFTPGLVDLLLEYGANPRLGETLSDQRFQSGGSKYQNTARRESFLKVWQAAHFDTKNNPKRDQAVWLSQGISRFDAFGRPFVYPVFGRAGASGPGTLRQLVQAVQADSAGGFTLAATEQGTLPVTITSLSGEAREALDLIAHLKSDENIALQWGDIVEVTYATGYPIADVLDPEAEFDIRLDLGNGNFFANAENASGPVMRIKPKESLNLDKVLWEAGVAPYFVAGTTHMRATEEGLVPSSARIRHGDVVQVTMAEAKPMSERTLRQGFHICKNPEGPFWNVENGWEPFFNGEAARQGASTWRNLLLAAVSPSGLPLEPIDWNAARARYWTGTEWYEVAFEETFNHFAGYFIPPPNLTLVLPASENGSRTLPEEWHAKLSDQASFDWQLGVLDEPLVKHRHTPPFFRIEEAGGLKIWRDLHPENAPRPVTDDITQLPMIDPRYPKFGSVEVDGSINSVLVKALQTSAANSAQQQQVAQPPVSEQLIEHLKNEAVDKAARTFEERSRK